MVLAPAATPLAVIWHELECGGYRADLELWRELAAEAQPARAHPGEPAARPAPPVGERVSASEDPSRPPPVLDVGAGSGRVTLELMRAGHTVTAVDLDAELLDALRRRAGAGAPETVCADARSMRLARDDHALCLVPMQTLQLLGGERGRGEFLRRAREHLRPGGLLACAIVTELEPFDCSGEELGPEPERTRVEGSTYTSSAVRVSIDRRTIAIERHRRIAPSPAAARTGVEASFERNVIVLDRVSTSRVTREGRAVGLKAAGTRTIAATAEHVGSEVVLLRA